MAVISDLRLVTLLPTENQTIYAFNVDNPYEYYSESFFAKMGTTWAFAVVPDRSSSTTDYFLNIIQTDNQTITVEALIPDIATETELRAGILNYYGSSTDRYTYTISYQNIRVFATAVEKSSLDTEYKTITPEQVDHQLILIVNSTGNTYAYAVDLPVNDTWKAVLIVEPGYTPGQMTVLHEESSSPEVLEEGVIASGFVNENLTISATEAVEEYSETILRPKLFDTSTTDYSNSDGYLAIGIGTEVSKQSQNILLYTEDKIDGDKVLIGTDEENMLYAVLGTKDDEKASRIIYKTSTQSRYLLKSLKGYYDYDYILGYTEAMSDSSLSPYIISNSYTSIVFKGFGFCADESPVNDNTKGHWFLIIDPPGNDNWSYIKFMMFDTSGKKVFSMIAYKDYFVEITEGNFIGQLKYEQDSKNGINDDAYLFLKNAFDNNLTVSCGVLIL